MRRSARFCLPVLLLALAAAQPAHAQISSTGGVTAVQIGESGATLEVDPQKGVNLGVDAGDTGGVTLGAGPQGVQLDVDRGGGASTPSPSPSPSSSQQSPSAQTPSSPTGSSPANDAPAGPEGQTGPVSGITEPGSGGGSSQSGSGDASGSDAGAGSRDRRVDTRPAAEREPRGVAPVIDLIEKVPPAVWAALAALGLIALALWLMWVRGRRRLERNAWVDTESPEMNVVAFETLLAQEWARSDRYRRPLGLLLLELEEPTSDGGRRSLTGKFRGDAQDAITAQARPSDIVAQLSPSRFAVICPESSLGSVETLARALEHSLEAARLHARVGTAGKLESDRGPADLVSRAAVGIDEQPTWATPVITPAQAPEQQPVPA
jgi:GGDEF domain-containing protein